jgi:hypothetical protein
LWTGSGGAPGRGGDPAERWDLRLRDVDAPEGFKEAIEKEAEEAMHRDKEQQEKKKKDAKR